MEKTVDKRGRLALGIKYAGRTVIVNDTNPDQIVITLARVIPEKEAWLYKNQDALESVQQGLAQAADGQLIRNGLHAKASD